MNITLLANVLPLGTAADLSNLARAVMHHWPQYYPYHKNKNMTPSNLMIVIFFIIMATVGNVAAATSRPTQKPTVKAVPSQKPSQKVAPKPTFKPSKSPTLRPSYKVNTLVSIYSNHTLHPFVKIIFLNTLSWLKFSMKFHNPPANSITDISSISSSIITTNDSTYWSTDHTANWSTI